MGTGSDYFRIWIVNLCLSLLSLGLLSAWAKVRTQRYFYSHTLLDGTPFQYLGTPLPILKGHVLAALLGTIWFVTFRVWAGLGTLVVVGAALLLPWAAARAVAFTARSSAYRNMTFHFGGSALGLAQVLYGWVFVTVFTGGLCYPKLRREVTRYVIERLSFGGVRARFRARSRAFFRPYVVVAIATALCTAAFVLVARCTGTGISEREVQLGMLLGYAGYSMGFAYCKARITNLVWNGSSLGPLRFTSRMTERGLSMLYLTNLAAIVASLGLLIPWARIRTARYEAEHLSVRLRGSLAEFEGSVDSSAHAVGSEVVELFDLGAAP